MNRWVKNPVLVDPDPAVPFRFIDPLPRKATRRETDFSFSPPRLETVTRIFALVSAISAAPCFAATGSAMSASLPVSGDRAIDGFDLGLVGPNFARTIAGRPAEQGSEPRRLRAALPQPVTLPIGSWSLAAGEAAQVGPPSQGQIDPDKVPLEDEPSPESVAKSLKLKYANPITEQVDLAPGEGRIFADLRYLRDQISTLQRPMARASVRYSTQSDHLDIRQEDVSQEFYFKYGRSRAGIGMTAINYDPRGASNINLYGVTLSGHHKITDFSEITGEIRLNRVKGRAVDYDKITFDTYATFLPTDEIRIDLDVNRRIFDNVKSLMLNISSISMGGSIDYTPTNNIRATVRAAYSTFSDTNRRRTAEVEGVWRIKENPSIEVGFRATNFHFSKMLDNGYFNPRNYVSGEAVVRVRADLSKSVTVDFTGSGGAERGQPGNTKPLVKGAARVSYKITDRWSLDGELSYFSSRSSSASGFARTSGMVGLRYRF